MPSVDLCVSTVPGAWVERAACLGADLEIFFPPKGQSITEARAICADCPVLVECRSYIDRAEGGRVSEVYGFVAGESPRQRIRRRAP
jgi:WhiB family transcriptional regulator, redox-sensing transcriptional regulator